MDDNTNKAFSTVVSGVSGSNGHFVLLMVLAILSIVGIAGFSYIFLNALEKQAATCAADNTHNEAKLDDVNKSINEMVLRIELLNQRVK
jgi:hypothetical protein